MLGKLLGKVAGELVALPLTVLSEGERAIDAAGQTIDKRVTDLTEPKK